MDCWAKKDLRIKDDDDEAGKIRFFANLKYLIDEKENPKVIIKLLSQLKHR